MTHTYADGPNNYTITVDLTDEDGPFASAGSKAITVDNVAPTIDLSGDATTNEGSLYTLTLGEVDDPGDDTVSACSIDWGDGTLAGDCLSSINSTMTHTYADGPNNYTITVDLTDEDGPFASAGSKAITVDNVAPTIDLSGDATTNEGSLYTLTLGEVDDPGDDTVSACSIDWGDGTLAGDCLSSINSTMTHTYADGPTTPTITVDLTDEDGPFASAGSKEITVDNVDPTVTTLSLTSNSIDEGGTATLGGSFTDPGVLDTHSVDIDWGDGTAHSTVPLAANVLTFSGETHTYADDNPTGTSSDNYIITVTVTDKDSGSDSDTTSITVNDAAPVFTAENAVTNPTKFGSGAICAVGGADNVTLNYGFTDPGTDTWTIAIDWANDGTFEETHSNVSKTGSYSHLYATAGLHTAAIKVTDDDTGTSTVTRTVWVNYNLSSILQPVNDTGHGANPSVFKFGSTIPVKVEVMDCNGSHPSNLVLKLTTTVTASTTPPGEDEVASTSAADSGNQMRFSDPLYIFNLASKSVTTDPSSSARLFVSLMNGSTPVQNTNALIGFKK